VIPVRKSTVFLSFLCLNIIALILVFLHAAYKRESSVPLLREKADMVKRLELTDLSLFTDARYTRQPSMADLNTPFQDYPMSFEHFPSGSLFPPPPHIKDFSVRRPAPGYPTQEEGS